jgi:hypothetical protein
LDKSGIKFRVIRFEEKYALLKHEDEKIGYMLWPIIDLPENTPLGSDIYLTARTQNELAEAEMNNAIANTDTNSSEKTEQQFEVMRRLLEELVN